MASNTSIQIHSPTYRTDPTTTFVEADPSNFRAVVQKLTGASEDSSSENQKLPLTLPPPPPPPSSSSSSLATKKPNFKLQERRHTGKNLELSIGVSLSQTQTPIFFNFSGSMSPSPSPLPSWYAGNMYSNRGGSEMVMASPVSPLEVHEEEERAIAEKGFYFHPTPLTTPTPHSHPPQLLPLFPLHSPQT